MAVDQRIVLITGCSDGGLGSALANEFHSRGLRVLATARSIPKMSELADMGIETFELDVESPSSITECLSKVETVTGGVLDLLVNNAGVATASMILDLDLKKSRQCFDINFWSFIAITQTFFPLLRAAQKQGRGQPIILNHTSISAGCPFPNLGIYCASKAAAASLTDTMRLEFQPFGIRVVELRSGQVVSKISQGAGNIKLPPKSLYNVAKEPVEKALRVEYNANSKREDPKRWAANAVSDLLSGGSARQIWRGASAGMTWFSGAFLPPWVLEMLIRDMSGMNAVEKAVAAERSAEGRKAV